MSTTLHPLRGPIGRYGSALCALLATAALGTALTSSGCAEPMDTAAAEPEGGEESGEEVGEAQQALGANLALGKFADQKSTYTGSSIYPVATKATDGNTNGDFQAGSVTSTYESYQPWWYVDLGAFQEVGTVLVWNRTDCCSERLRDFYLMDSLALPQFTTNNYWAGPAPGQISFNVNRPARYVGAMLSGTGFLSLAEVQVFSPPNLALGKPATQSSTYMGSSVSGAASNAVDGNIDGNFQAGSVTHTNNEQNAWWQVDLGSSQYVRRVWLRNRTDCCADRLTNFNVMVSDNGTDWQTWVHPGTMPPTQWWEVNRTARYVKVQLNGWNYLSLAEVQVY